MTVLNQIIKYMLHKSGMMDDNSTIDCFKKAGQPKRQREATR